MTTFYPIPARDVEVHFPSFWHPSGVFALVIRDAVPFGVVGLLPMSPSVGWLSYCTFPQHRSGGYMTRQTVHDILHWPHMCYNIATVMVWTERLSVQKLLTRLGYACVWNGPDSRLFVIEKEKTWDS